MEPTYNFFRSSYECLDGLDPGRGKLVAISSKAMLAYNSCNILSLSRLCMYGRSFVVKGHSTYIDSLLLNESSYIFYINSQLYIGPFCYKITTRDIFVKVGSLFFV